MDCDFLCNKSITLILLSYAILSEVLGTFPQLKENAVYILIYKVFRKSVLFIISKTIKIISITLGKNEKL